MRLLAVIVLPMVALGALGTQRVSTEQDNADRARAIVRGAELQRAVAAVVGPAQLEQIALEGLARIDELGVPRDAVVEIAGVDLQTTYDTNKIEFEGALDALVAEHGDVVLSDGVRLSDRLSFVRGALQVQRIRSAERRAPQADVRAVFDQLDDVLAEAGRARSSGGPATFALASSGRLQLKSLTTMTSAAGDRGKALLDALTARSPEHSRAIVASVARLEATIESYRQSLDPAEVAAFDAVQQALIPVADFLIETTTTSIADSSALDPAYITQSADALLDQLAYLDALEEYSSVVHDQVVAELEHQAQDAESAKSATRLMIVGITIASVALLALVGWSVLRPLRRLTRRARQVGRGDLAAAALPVRGPRDVRTLTTSMNEMLATLQSVDEQIAALSAGSVAQGVALPGAVGVSLRGSFDRLQQMTSKLHASEALASAIVAQAADAIWTVDQHGLIRSANAASASVVGAEPDEQIGTPIRSYLTSLDGEALIVGGEGSTQRFLVAHSSIDGAAEPLTAVIARDITERLHFEERLAYQAHHDALTGLPNRFAVLEAIQTAPTSSPLAILFVDLDGFKTVNDVQGHVAGDGVLVEVGRRLAASIRPGDFAGRLGGDEFIIVMSDYDQVADVVAFATRLIREVEQPYADDTTMFALSASVGVSVYPEGLAAAGLTALEAVREADTAVYHAKRRGRGRVELFDRTLRDEVVRLADLEIALRQAISNNELELHLQPIMDLRSGEFTSAEALVRWHRPGHGLVSPADFIPVAERSSIIVSIDRWMLTEACRTLARWREVDPECSTRIAVNISGRHLAEDHLLVDLEAALTITGADPELLTLELTESQLLDDLPQATRVLESVRAQGIGIAIDDFGTGYSSMSYLQRLPIDTIKIDRSFIASSDSSVLGALLTIGAALGTSIVAEGIETEEQLDFLRARGCDRGQGFLLARPTPVDAAEVVLGTGEAFTDALISTDDEIAMLSPLGSAL